MVVDDEAANVELLARLLQQEGYTTTTAFNGRQALDSISKETPDILLLDILMPVLDGLSVCRRLREDFRTRGLPIILLTAKDSPDDRLDGFRAGADDYITKPFDLSELKARIRGTLQRHRWDQGTHPLSHLPGSPGIEEEVRKRLAAQTPFAFAYIDVDNFKAYNDAYGYDAGDKVLKGLSTRLIEAALGPKGELAFPGHIGGDDFILIAGIEHMKKALPLVAQNFDNVRHTYYRAEDRARGYIQTVNRQSQLQTFPFITLSIAVVSTETRQIHHYARLAEIASELKHYIKSLDHRGHSLVMWDRRTDARPGPAARE